MNKEIKLHTIATFQDKEYELEELLNELLKENFKLQQKIEKAIEYIEENSIGSILEVHCGEEEEYTEPLLEILKGGNDE